MPAFLTVQDLSFGYTRNQTLKQINFSVNRGEFLGIIGPNGAGKTTLLKNLNRSLAAQEGRVFLEGEDLLDLSLKQIAQKVSMVNQDIQLSFSLTVLDLVLLGRFPHLQRFKKQTENDLEVARQCLELTQTLELADRQFNQLSAGERQRVILAKALVQQPQLLLLDEPTAHLDIGHQIKMLDLLSQLNRERQLTAIAVLHDLNLASEYCQRLLLLNRGRIASYGSCAQVLKYATIEKVYSTVVLVKENPLSQKPYILPIPGRYGRLKPLGNQKIKND